MQTPRSRGDPGNPVKLLILLSKNELSALDDWCVANSVATRAQGLRALLRAGIASDHETDKAGRKPGS